MLGSTVRQKVFLGLLLSTVVLTAAQAVDSNYLDPARIDYVRPDSSTQLELIDCFVNGICEQDDKIRIYPMPCHGSGGADCTGCYVMRSGSPVRIQDLNSSGTCAGVGRPDEQKLRVFVGYERKCPSGTATCDDGQLLLSCSISTEGEAGETGQLLSYDKDCFAGQPYIRRAKGSVATVAVTVTPTVVPTDLAQCPAGMTGIYPTCSACADTTYKPTSGSNACTTCTSPTILNSESVTYSTAGTTKSSANDCKVTGFTCKSGFTANLAKGTCDADSCSLDFTITRTQNASAPGVSDGALSMLASTTSAGPVSFTMSPNVGTRSTGSSTSGSLNMFWMDVTSVPAGSYSVAAGDLSKPSCVVIKTVLIGAAPAPSPTPSPSPSLTCRMTVSEYNSNPPSSASASDASIAVQTTGMYGAVTFSISPNVGNQSYGANGQFGVTGLGSGSYVFTASDAAVPNCVRSATISIAYVPPPSPTPTPSPTIPPCEQVREISNTHAGVPSTGSWTRVIRFPPNIQDGDRYLFMLFDNWLWITATATDTSSSLATQLADTINGRSPQQWEDWGAHSRTPAVGTPYFPPTATATAADVSVVTNYKTLFYYDWRVFRAGCYGQ